jgi:hippurate hydrolase
MTIRQTILDINEEIKTSRREMHQNPGTAYEEEFASALIQKKLKEWDIRFESGIATTGVVATLEGKRNKSGKSIGLRADIDALDILEENNKPHASRIPGKMHGCGHDGHTAMLLGAAKILKDDPDFDGIVHFIFQPAEEGEKGAHAMIAEGLFEKFPCESVYGLHNWPYLPRGTLATRPGPIMACADFFEIVIKGTGGHAATPHRCVDPIVVGSQIINALQTLVSRYTDPIEPVVLSVTNFISGTGAFNVIPDDAVLKGTMRCFDNELREDLNGKIEEISTSIARAMGAQIEYRYDYVIDATVNDPQATEACVEIARGLFGEHNVDDDMMPSPGGEDFGAMLFERPGCYVVLGQAEPGKIDSPSNFGLHTPRYDFNDDIIPLGMEYWVRLVENLMPLSK